MKNTDAREEWGTLHFDLEEEKKLEQWQDYQDYLQEIELDDEDRRILEWWKR